MKVKHNKQSVFIIFSDLLTTDALINSIRILYILQILNEVSLISLLNFSFLVSTFIFEIPTGFIGDKFGNKKIVVLSKISFIISILFLVFGTTRISFILSFFFLGLFSALESGAKNSYFISLFNDVLDYKKLVVKTRKLNYSISFLFAVLSSVLYGYNNRLPFIITLILAFISLLLIAILPKEFSKTNKISDSNMLSQSKIIIKDILNNKHFLVKLVLYTIMTTITIFGFYYYNMLFRDNNVPSILYGIIYSSFSLLGVIGVNIFQNRKLKKVGKTLILLFPFTFILLISHNIVFLFIAVIIQEIVFSFLLIEFDMTVINEINGRGDSSQFQSTVSFLYSGVRMIITAIVAFIMSVTNIYTVFILMFIIAICLTIIQFSYFEKISILKIKDSFE